MHQKRSTEEVILSEEINIKMQLLFLHDVILELLHIMKKKNHLTKEEISRIKIKLTRKAKKEYNLPPEKRIYIEHPPIYNGFVCDLELLDKKNYEY